MTISTPGGADDDGEMNIRHRPLGLVAVALAVALPLVGTSTAASAKAKPGCHKSHTCKSGGSAPTGSGTGATTGPITVQIDPDPVVEIGSSTIAVVIQVEASPSLAGDVVNVSSSQLSATCTAFTGFIEFGSLNVNFPGTPLDIPLTLDDDGNATMDLFGSDCAPGSSVIEADLTVAPYDTALATVDAMPPVVTTPGVFGFPTSSGSVAGGEVETGDTGPAADQSDVFAVFDVEADPVYAEQPVEISLNQLQSRCLAGEGYAVLPSGGFSLTEIEPGGVQSTLPTVPLDDDGNAVFIFIGGSCAAGPSVVTADVLAGSHPTYTTTFNILPPQPTT
jgi:hypothetical protein